MLGPPVGGSLASNGHWRWLFCKPLIHFIRSCTTLIPRYFDLKDMNIPLTGFAATIVFCFLRTKRPHGPWIEKVTKIDWMYVCVFSLSYKEVSNFDLRNQWQLDRGHCNWVDHTFFDMGRNPLPLVQLSSSGPLTPRVGGYHWVHGL